MKQRQVSSLRRAGDVIEDKEEGKEDVETTRKLSLSRANDTRTKKQESCIARGP